MFQFSNFVLTLSQAQTGSRPLSPEAVCSGTSSLRTAFMDHPHCCLPASRCCLPPSAFQSFSEQGFARGWWEAAPKLKRLQVPLDYKQKAVLRGTRKGGRQTMLENEEEFQKLSCKQAKLKCEPDADSAHLALPRTWPSSLKGWGRGRLPYRSREIRAKGTVSLPRQRQEGYLGVMDHPWDVGVLGPRGL